MHAKKITNSHMHSARSSFYCFIEEYPKRCLLKKIEIFLRLRFYDMTVPSKSNVPSL